MTLTIRANGLEFKNFTSAKVETGIEQASRGFSFLATAKEGELIPIKEGDAVEILADGVRILTGHVELPVIQYDSRSHSINVSGRSKTGDYIDSTVGSLEDPNKKDFDKIGFEALCKLVVNPMLIDVVNLAGTIKDFEDIASAETGQTAFNFLELFARKRQVLLTDNEKGDLVITKNSKTLASAKLINILNNDKNNIKNARKSIDLSKVFYKYIVHSQANPVDIVQLNSAKQLSEAIGVVFDKEMGNLRKTRILEIQSEEAGDIATATQRAKWEMSVRRSRAFNYSCTVQGHTVDGVAWAHNLLYRIDDAFCNLHDNFLCKKVIFNYNVIDGSTTDLVFTTKNAYTLQSELDTIRQK